MDNGKLTAKEEAFCFFLAESNNRLTAIEQSGYCQRIVNDADGRSYTTKERHKMQTQACKLLQQTHIKKRVDELTEARIKYLNEHGVATELEVLQYFTDVMNGEKGSDNPFMLQQRISAAKELLVYYREKLKIKGKDNLSNPSGTKEFIVKYTEKKEGVSNANKTE